MYSSEGCSVVWREKDGTNELNKKFTTFYRDEGKYLGVRMLRTVCSKWVQESSGPDGTQQRGAREVFSQINNEASQTP